MPRVDLGKVAEVLVEKSIITDQQNRGCPWWVDEYHRGEAFYNNLLVFGGKYCGLSGWWSAGIDCLQPGAPFLLLSQQMISLSLARCI